MDLKNIILQKDKVTGKLKLVIWIGAGIDALAPTSLPLGNGLTNFMLEHACTSGISKELKKCTSLEKKDEILTRYYGKPRLETVIECYKHVEKSFVCAKSEYPFLNGFSIFWERKPNQNHYLIADLLLRGAEIVTTNYDRCIPMACEEICSDKSMHLQQDTYEENTGYYCFQNHSNACGKLYYIHGIAADLNTLGATITQLKDGLLPKFRKQIKTWLEEGYTFLFLGYGGLDSLDVNPFFLSLDNYTNTYGIYVRHSKTKRVIKERQFYSNEKCLLTCFQNKIVCEEDTNTLLRSLCNNEYYVSEMSSENWEDEFKAKADMDAYSEEVKMALNVELCYRLGLKSKGILPKKWWEILLENEEITRDYIQRYGFDYGKSRRDQKIIQCFIPEKNTKLSRSDYFASAHKYKEAAEIFGTPKEIIDRVEQLLKNEDEKVDWDVCTALNRWFDYILLEIIRRPFRILKNIKRFEIEANIIINAYKMLLCQGTKLTEISQRNTAMRALTILERIYQNENRSDISILEIIEDCKRISYMTEAISTMSLYIMDISLDICLYNNYSGVRKAGRILIELLMLIINNHLNYYIYHVFGGVTFLVYSFIFGKIISKRYKNERKKVSHKHIT